MALSYLGHTLIPRGSWDPSAAAGCSVVTAVWSDRPEITSEESFPDLSGYADWVRNRLCAFLATLPLFQVLEAVSAPGSEGDLSYETSSDLVYFWRLLAYQKVCTTWRDGLK